MRIVHIVRQYEPSKGGLETVVERLAREQVAAGHEVRIVTLNRVFGDERRLSKKYKSDGLEIIRIPFFGSSRYPIAPSVLCHIGWGDIVHVHAIDFFFDFLAFTKIAHRKRMIVSTHGGFFHTEFASKFKKIYFSVVTRLSISAYSFVAASSESDLKLFKSIRTNGIAAILNGVDCEKFLGAAKSRELKVMIYFGRFSENKNISSILNFLVSLRKIDSDWKLVIAGRSSGISSDSILREAEGLNIGSAVRVVDEPSDAALRNEISQTSVFVSASRYEGFGIAAIEAISGGLFPVLSDIQAHRDTVSRTGIGHLVDFSSSEEAARSSLLALHAWQRIGHGGHLQVDEALKKLAWVTVAQRFEHVYRVVLGDCTRNILGLQLNVTNEQSVFHLLDMSVTSRTTLRLAFVNANLANISSLNLGVKSLLQDFFLVNDGLGIDIASSILYRAPFPENLNGTDFIPRYLSHSRRGLRVFILGGSESISRKAFQVFKAKWPWHEFVGYHHGFFSDSEEPIVSNVVREAQPDVVLVAMGNPRQEIWIAKHIPALAPVGIGVGALLDFEASQFRRAPELFRKFRMEWLYRFSQEPNRLWRRYIVGNAAFLGRVFVQFVSGYRG